VSEFEKKREKKEKEKKRERLGRNLLGSKHPKSKISSFAQFCRDHSSAYLQCRLISSLWEQARTGFLFLICSTAFSPMNRGFGFNPTAFRGTSCITIIGQKLGCCICIVVWLSKSIMA